MIAGTDCGFCTFAAFGAVDADIVYAKFAAMAEGAGIASRQHWGPGYPCPLPTIYWIAPSPLRH